MIKFVLGCYNKCCQTAQGAKASTLSATVAAMFVANTLPMEIKLDVTLCKQDLGPML